MKGNECLSWGGRKECRCWNVFIRVDEKIVSICFKLIRKCFNGNSNVYFCLFWFDDVFVVWVVWGVYFGKFIIVWGIVICVFEVKFFFIVNVYICDLCGNEIF